MVVLAFPTSEQWKINRAGVSMTRGHGPTYTYIRYSTCKVTVFHAICNAAQSTRHEHRGNYRRGGLLLAAAPGVESSELQRTLALTLLIITLLTAVRTSLEIFLSSPVSLSSVL